MRAVVQRVDSAAVEVEGANLSQADFADQHGRTIDPEVAVQPFGSSNVDEDIVCG